ncbi:hypothetical protein PUNSTDRAFT_65493 [Punctularia strigosozonata HHB-11173 SS5]|uniref:uncharacterized protein n=1 Tax=Punctularia strigosozonata (strain HHB-11173) TaxID=741275 RepID=UPI000441781D|nr:uncharacterized protein PUNSTDRAFT_65493 [Punctularia strigosozonata HHB-11173 SS5]EIN10815.1 hypothetical protein PUNSTDRAFT_65493 [Punctularia strigosozonata HHB-11173 SS5]
MDQMLTYEALLFPADGRPPHLVGLTTSLDAISTSEYYSGRVQATRIPHPEVYMDYIAEIGSRAWQYHPVHALDGMSKNLPNPYAIFYPVISRDGMPFPVNKCVKEIQGKNFREETAWRGNLVVAKFTDTTYTAMVDASMADFPLIKNYLLTHHSPVKVSRRSLQFLPA